MNPSRQHPMTVVLLCLAIAGCVTNPQLAGDAGDGQDVVVRGCLSKYSDVGTYFYLSPQCLHYTEARKVDVMTLDVSTETVASARFVRTHALPACVEVQGTLQMYGSSGEGFLIPSGYLIGRGLLAPTSITRIDCARLGEVVFRYRGNQYTLLMADRGRRADRLLVWEPQ